MNMKTACFHNNDDRREPAEPLWTQYKEKVLSMAIEPAELTRTDKNLWNAIVSEAMAYLKYNAYAHRALEEGYPEVAQIFQEVAGAENIHGMNHLRVAGEIGSTIENLRAVTEGEAKEFSTMYPRMIYYARAEGRADVADSFALAMERESHHLTAFTKALADLEVKQAQAAASLPVIPAQSLPSAPAFAGETGAGIPPGAGVVEPPTADGHPQALAAAPSPSPSPSPRSPVAPASVQRPDLDTFVRAAIEVDREKWRVASLGRLREVVFGAQDGLLSTVALVVSLAVALDNHTAVIVAGLAAAAAGMISMATGAFLGSRAEQDVRRVEIVREAREIEEKPGEELAELVVIFQREGRTYEEAQAMADEVAQDKELWLNTLLEKELGISPEDTASPIKDAVTMGLSFAVAAIVPIIPFVLFEGMVAIWVSVTAALLGLFILGSWKGRLVQKTPILQGLEILAIGAVSAGIGFALGEMIPRLIT